MGVAYDFLSMCVVCQAVSAGAAALTGLLPIAVPEAPPEAVAVIERAVESRTSSAPSIFGTTCKTVGEVRRFGSQSARCTLVGKKRIWRRTSGSSSTATLVTTTTIAATTTTTTTTVPSSRLTIYQSGPGRTQSAVRVPSSASLDTSKNFRVWLYHPEQTDRTYSGASFWMRTPTTSWVWHSASAEGFVQLSLAPGQYTLDTVEPTGQESRFSRRLHYVNVAANGTVTISGLTADSNGVFGLTVNQRPTAATFAPRSDCDVQDATGITNMNNAMPRNRDRLAGSGRIRALIIPVDFADVPGVGDPATLFANMASGTAEFFRDQSGGRVSFDFQVLDKFVRMPTASNHFNLGAWSQGDPSGYYRQALDTADPLVDFSLFDVVYVLSPPNIPSSSISYGPAFPSRFMTNDGDVLNGTISGADAHIPAGLGGWRWMAHETGHLFGLHDLYRIPTTDPATFGAWDIMKDNWTSHAVELSAWHRYVLEWLADSNIECIDMRRATTTARSINVSALTNSNTTDKRAVFLRLDEHRVAVVELRTDSKYDRVGSQSGVLVYVVDQRVAGDKGGWTIIRPTRSTDRDFKDAALRTGESVTIDRVSITVESLSATQASVRISAP